MDGEVVISMAWLLYRWCGCYIDGVVVISMVWLLYGWCGCYIFIIVSDFKFVDKFIQKCQNFLRCFVTVSVKVLYCVVQYK